MAMDYDVFVSYRHRPMDEAAARGALAFLESYRLPVEFERAGHRGVGRVFRDTEELSVSGILEDAIVQALNSARVLVVVCSPDTPESEWVDREVQYFIGLGRADRIYALLIAGDAEQSFPPSLRNVPDIAERTMDARGGSDRERAALMRDRLLAVVARCADVRHPDLIRAHRLRGYRRATVRYLGGAALLALVGAVSVGLWSMAATFRDAANREQRATMALAGELTYSLPATVARVPGVLDIVRRTLTDNAGHIDRIIAISPDADRARRERAANFEKLASVHTALGDADAALQASTQAVELYRDGYERSGGADALGDYASGLVNLGNCLGALGEHRAALERYAEAAALLEGPAQGDRDAAADLAACLHNMALNRAALGDARGAIEADESCVALLGPLAADGHPQALGALMNARLSLGDAHTRLGEHESAIAQMREAVAIAERLHQMDESRATLASLTSAHSALARGLSAAGQYGEAAAAYAAAIGGLDILARDEQNAAALDSLATACANCGYNLNITGRYDEADIYYERAVALRQALAASGNPVAVAAYARALYSKAENAMDSNLPDRARADYERCLAAYAPVAARLGAREESEYLARLAFYAMTFGGDIPSALEHAEQAAALAPDSSFVGYILSYALMYSDQEERFLAALDGIAARGENERRNLREDFKMLRNLGLPHPLMDEAERHLAIYGEEHI